MFNSMISNSLKTDKGDGYLRGNNLCEEEVGRLPCQTNRMEEVPCRRPYSASLHRRGPFELPAALNLEVLIQRFAGQVMLRRLDGLIAL